MDDERPYPEGCVRFRPAHSCGLDDRWNAVLGVVTASLASWLVENVAAQTAADVEAADASVRRELAEVRAQLQLLTDGLQRQRGWALNPQPVVHLRRVTAI